VKQLVVTFRHNTSEQQELAPVLFNHYFFISAIIHDGGVVETLGAVVKRMLKR
jgi:hypothetical protein